MYKNELVKHLSPVHSPMLCTAVYMRKYENVGAKIAALSPCVAKSHEFEATGLVEYNVTIKNFYDYIKKNRIMLPREQSGFDHYEAGLGSLYPMPGGLKESVEHYIGKGLRVDKSEGQSVVYKALDEYAKQPQSKLPVLFDVLNCPEGCNLGTGCNHDINIFDINTMMDEMRQDSISEDNVQYLDQLFEKFDEELRLDDFIRTYRPAPVRKIPVMPEKLKEAFWALGKYTEESKRYDCGACGNNSCLEMAERVAKGIDFPSNCLDKAHQDIKIKHGASVNLQKTNLKDFDTILKDTGNIKDMTGGILSNIIEINDAIQSNARMAKDIEKIAKQVNIIAINASIEAARAGEHGKAFACVADEIRKLAQNSNKSALETKAVSAKASEVITTVTDPIYKIDGSVKKFFNDVSVISENTKNLLNDISSSINVIKSGSESSSSGKVESENASGEEVA
jgi:hypothetical protein